MNQPLNLTPRRLPSLELILDFSDSNKSEPAFQVSCKKKDRHLPEREREREREMGEMQVNSIRRGDSIHSE